ncbi:hypothetical protein Back11_06780 [Paenibacillus baekrokdamisoli]|uniref:Copper amine oxidase-like N-terminal domain-containing protein n=1 Tax=Paenibacillus baekrokdamisoli TaxID=1712516 RepID=A0A3G9J3P6_9BACL|nr:stalk domain-containing protein [Paenibacillus baekrokdamisoli]MBB3067482.1 sugar lactone lactonase YvrE [Paenibacillus baekrokdamisoli]BBH19333.1 hypothetical protein Back11_06780 [Paenibacillus baekrokdamisoli]
MKKWKNIMTYTLAATVAWSSFSMVAAADGAVTSDSVLKNKSMYEVYTVAGTGEFNFKDGKLGQEAFREPSSLLYENDTFLVADSLNQRLRVVTAKGTHEAAGIELGTNDYQVPIGGLINGTVDKAAFNSPTGLALDKNGTVYLADAENHAIRTIDEKGNVATLAGNGNLGLKDGAAKDAKFYHPLDVAVTKDGVVYVADTLNHVIRKIQNGEVTTLNAASTRIVEYVPGAVETSGDFADGPLAEAKFNEPSGLALDSKGNLYVSDTGNDRIRYIDFAEKKVSTVAGGMDGQASPYPTDSLYAAGGYADGKAVNALFHAPRGLTVTPEGGVLIADSLNHVIRYLKDGQVTTVAGQAEEAGTGDGLAQYATFNRPTDVIWMGNGVLGVADAGNNKIRLIAPYEAPEGLKLGAKVHLIYNSTLLKTDASPIVLNNSVFVPVRILTEQLGFKVQYSKGMTTLTQGDISYQLQAGSSKVTKTIKGQAAQTLTLVAKPLNNQNRLFLPVRFFAEEIGLDVQWLSDIHGVLLRDKKF